MPDQIPNADQQHGQVINTSPEVHGTQDHSGTAHILEGISNAPRGLFTEGLTQDTISRKVIKLRPENTQTREATMRAKIINTEQRQTALEEAQQIFLLLLRLLRWR